jgi:hypothetical protein
MNIVAVSTLIHTTERERERDTLRNTLMMIDHKTSIVYLFIMSPHPSMLLIAHELRRVNAQERERERERETAVKVEL